MLNLKSILITGGTGSFGKKFVETIIKRYPDAKQIETVAKAIAPNARLEYIGIRPCEKLHEEMITESDSYNTIEFDRYYAILPSGAPNVEKYLNHYNARFVEPGFKYNSGTNTEWETIESIREKIKKIC